MTKVPSKNCYYLIIYDKCPQMLFPQLVDFLLQILYIANTTMADREEIVQVSIENVISTKPIQKLH